MTYMSIFHPAPIQPSMAPQVQILFSEVFQQPMSAALWHWKYGDGRGFAYGVWDEDDKLIGHYGGIQRAINFFGAPSTALQMGDVMTHPAARSTLARKSPFYLMTHAFLQRWLGYDQPFLLGFGFPNDRHQKIAEKLGLYAKTGHVLLVSWPARRADNDLSYQTMQTHRDWRNVIDQLWAAMRADFADAILGERNADWLTHRYLNHPEHAYHCYLVFREQQPLGCIVLRQHADHFEWIDVVAPRQAWPALTDIAQSLAASAGFGRLDSWISAPFHQFFAGDPIVTDIGVSLPCNVLTPGPAPALLRDRWFLMSGDTDFR